MLSLVSFSQNTSSRRQLQPLVGEPTALESVSPFPSCSSFSTTPRPNEHNGRHHRDVGFARGCTAPATNPKFFIMLPSPQSLTDFRMSNRGDTTERGYYLKFQSTKSLQAQPARHNQLETKWNTEPEIERLSLSQRQSRVETTNKKPSLISIETAADVHVPDKQYAGVTKAVTEKAATSFTRIPALTLSNDKNADAVERLNHVSASASLRDALVPVASRREISTQTSDHDNDELRVKQLLSHDTINHVSDSGSASVEHLLGAAGFTESTTSNLQTIVRSSINCNLSRSRGVDYNESGAGSTSLSDEELNRHSTEETHRSDGSPDAESACVRSSETDFVNPGVVTPAELSDDSSSSNLAVNNNESSSSSLSGDIPYEAEKVV